MNRATVMTRMDNAKTKDKDKDENNRRGYRKKDRKKDIIVCGTCTGIFGPIPH